MIKIQNRYRHCSHCLAITVLACNDCLNTVPRAYRAAEGGERACNSRTSCIEGEMLAVTKFKSKSDTLIRRRSCLIRLKRRHTASLRDLNLVTASISPSIQDQGLIY